MRGKGRTPAVMNSYLLSWQRYIAGNVVSAAAARYIKNMMSATAARVTERDPSSDEDSEESDIERFKSHAGSLELVHKTLQGIA